MPPTATAESLRTRNLSFMGKPELWPVWPYLPLMRRRPDQEEEYGLLYDALHVSGKTGYSAAVIFCNLFLIPSDEAELLALPKEIFDSPDEIFEAGWRID